MPPIRGVVRIPAGMNVYRGTPAALARITKTVKPLPHSSRTPPVRSRIQDEEVHLQTAPPQWLGDPAALHPCRSDPFRA